MGKYDLTGKRSSASGVLIFGLAALFLPTALIIAIVLRHTHGIFMYPYDDTFIHLTIADNLRSAGAWGINGNEFASASSSVLYTLVLTLFRFFSSSVLVPFVVNCLAGIALLWSVQGWLRKQGLGPVSQGIILLLVIVCTPLPLLIISGMEHTLQCLFSFLFLFRFSDWLEENKHLNRQLPPPSVLILSVLLASIRYEGLFLIAIACLLLLLHRKLVGGIVLGLVGLAPLLLFGWISVSKGSYFLPNSVLVKSGTFSISSPLRFVSDILFDRLVYAKNGMAAMATQRLLIALPLMYLIFKRYIKPSYSYILVLLFGATLLQLSFASTGYLYRYEAYLFCCVSIIVPVILFRYGRMVLAQLDSLPSKLASLALVFFLIFPIVLRSMTALDKTSQACLNIYDQQYQMASFTRRYYDQGSVALNDIGAVGYYSGARIVDLWGLANIEVTRSRKQHNWTPAFLDSLCHARKVELAMIYDSWFTDSLTKKWSKMASWQIQNNVICGDSIVSFYALDSLQKNRGIMNLKAFEAELPSSVKVKYY